MQKAIFPGSFDPITIGHVDLVHRAIPLFEEIVVAIGHNTGKAYLFELDQRLMWLKKVFEKQKTVTIDYYEGLTANYCKKVNAHFIIRGLRNASDFDYEKTISQLNNVIGENLETVFFISRPEYSHISSTIVREIIRGGGNATPFLPAEIEL